MLNINIYTHTLFRLITILFILFIHLMNVNMVTINLIFLVHTCTHSHSLGGSKDKFFISSERQENLSCMRILRRKFFSLSLFLSLTSLLFTLIIIIINLLIWLRSGKCLWNHHHSQTKGTDACMSHQYFWENFSLLASHVYICIMCVPGSDWFFFLINTLLLSTHRTPTGHHDDDDM